MLCVQQLILASALGKCICRWAYTRVYVYLYVLVCMRRCAYLQLFKKLQSAIKWICLLQHTDKIHIDIYIFMYVVSLRISGTHWKVLPRARQDKPSQAMPGRAARTMASAKLSHTTTTTTRILTDIKAKNMNDLNGSNASS